MRPLACLLLMTSVACAGGGPPPPDAGGGTIPDAAGSGPAPAESAATEHFDPGFAAALEEAASSGTWGDLHLFAECATDAGLESLEIFGDGVAIWDEERQFELPREEIASLLAAFERTGLAAMRNTYGGSSDLAEPEPDLAQEVVCRLRLRLGATVKEVVQLRKGRQSEELRRLALAVLDAGRGPARTGVGAASLEEGLAKIAAGELDPRAMELVLHRRPERAGEAGESWLLRLAGSEATVAAALAGAADEERRLRLASGELARLTRLLADLGVGSLPGNLYAESYTDLALKVLGDRQRIQARRFAGMTADTHGAAQERFDRILGELQQLVERTLAEGEAG